MIAVIFEVIVEPGRGQDYLDLAAGLRDELEQTDGFVSIERFQSLTTENKFVSLSFWRDRAAVEAWYRRPQPQDRTGRGPGRHLRRLPHPGRRGIPRLRFGGRAARGLIG